jgi:nitric oxide reductase subunit B
VQNGYWSARSAEFMQTSLMQNLRWARVLGDSIFGLGAFAFVWFALDLMLRKPHKETVPAADLVEA